MNKKFVKVAFVAAIALVGGVNVFNAQKTESLSDIALANVEALAELESNVTNTGPGEMVECTVFPGTKKECMCRNEFPCSPSPCS